MPTDKAQHFVLSWAGTLVLGAVLQQAGLEQKQAHFLAGGTVLALGLGKEFWDLQGHGTPEGADMIANAGGVTLAIFLGGMF
jgi:hypothetical protein